MKHKVYIAGPLFNKPQVETIKKIEEILEKSGIEYFSPREHSEGLLPPVEERKNPDSWYPLFKMNVEAIQSCTVLIAILSYEMIEGVRVGAKNENTGIFNTLELPDTGTVWEMGFAYGIGKSVVGFHPNKEMTDLNVMLTQCCTGFISGWEIMNFLFTAHGSEDPELNFDIFQYWKSQEGGIHDV